MSYKRSVNLERSRRGISPRTMRRSQTQSSAVVFSSIIAASMPHALNNSSMHRWRKYTSPDAVAQLPAHPPAHQHQM
ncbi:MAG: hypothetical protein ACE14M_15175 [Terriglobales bacterium]